MDGTPGFWAGTHFPGGIEYISPGETWEWYIEPTNMGFAGGPCTESDTFCVDMSDTSGWVLDFDLGDDDHTGPGECFILDAGYYWGSMIYVTCPCEAEIGEENLVTAIFAYCDVDGVCQPDSGFCVIFGGYEPYTSQAFEVVPAPPALYVDQDTLFFVERGVTTAYIPFGICNGDPCALPTDYSFMVTSIGHVGGPINQTGDALQVPGGECLDVYGEVDASLADVCDYDTLTIIAWSQDGSVYDTCVQAIHIVEPVPVPLFTAPVVTIMVLAMILAAAVIMKRHAVSKA
jgi:hypothetical protein